MPGTLLVFLPELWGMAVVWLLVAPAPGRRLRYAISYGPGLGLGLASLLLFSWRLASLPQPGAMVLFAVAVLTLALAAMVSRSRAPGRISLGSNAMRVPKGPTLLALLLFLVSLAAAVAGAERVARSSPNGAWDAVAMWNVRARFFQRGYDGFPQSFKAVDPQSHAHYPLLVPGAIAVQQTLLGHEAVWVGAWTGGVFLLGLGLVGAALVWDAGVPAFALAAAALMWTMPPVAKWGMSQMADIPLAYYLLGGFGGFASVLASAKGDRRLVCLSGVFVGLMAWTKNEGLVYAGILLALFAVWSWRKWGLRQASALAVWATLGAAPGIAAVLLQKLLWARTSGLEFFADGWFEQIIDPHRWLMPIQSIARMTCGWMMFESSGWGLLWPALQIAAVAAWWYRSTRSAWWLSFAGAVMVAVTGFWVLTYVVTPYSQAWHIASSLDRLVLQLFPALLVAVLTAAGCAMADRAWDDGSDSGADRPGLVPVADPRAVLYDSSMDGL